MIEVKVPQLPESVTDATLVNWHKKPGDPVARDENLVDLETDKVVLEVPAPANGVMGEIKIPDGATVTGGELLAILEEAEAGASVPAPSAAAPAATAGAAPVAQDSESAGETLQVKVPQLPESVSDATLVTWHKRAGEAVARDENLVDLETDKVVLEVPAPADGVLSEIKIADGATVVAGEVLALLTAGAVAHAVPAGGTATVAEQVAAAGGKKLGPAARRLVEEHGINPASLLGSGRDGRVTKGDVLEYLDNKPATPAPSAAADARPETASPAMLVPGLRDEKRVPMTRLRSRIAERMVEAQHTAAILTSFNEVDLSQVKALRYKYRDMFEKEHGVRLGYMSFFVKAAIEGLRKFPAVNAAVEDSDIVYHEYYDVGVAVSTDRGLVVPVLRNAETMSFAAVERSIGDYAGRARAGKLGLEDITGGTFTITNGGVFGSLLSTPILNPPQSAILGMHTIQDRPVAVDGEIKIRPMMYIALSYDHRIIDGKEAVQFLVTIKQALEDPARLMLHI